MKHLLFSTLILLSSISYAQDFSMVKEQLAEEDLTAANKTILKLVKQNPESAQAQYWSGAVMYRIYCSAELNPSKDYKPMVDAGISFERAKFLDPNCLQSTDGGHQLKSYAGKVFNLGVTSYQKEEVEMSFTFFKMATEVSDWLDTDDVDAFYYTGHCANLLSDYATAEKYLELALQKDPKHLNATKALVKAKIGQEDYADITGLIKESLVKNPDDKMLWHELMSVSMKLGDAEEALSAAQTLSHMDSGNPNNLAFLASLYDQTGNADKAMETYTECLVIDPDHQKATYNLGVLLYNEGVTTLNMAPSPEDKAAAVEKLKTAKEHLLKAQELDPSNQDIPKILKNIESLN